MEMFDSVSSGMQPQKRAREDSPRQPMSPANRRTATIVFAILAAAVAIIITITVVNASNRAADEEKQKQQDHDRSVSYYYGNYEQCGKAFCP